MDAPKRIWTDWKSANDACVAFDEPPARDSEGFRTEYILATEHDRIVAEKDAEIARLKLALGEILSYDRNFYDSGRPGYEAIARAALKESPDA